MSVTVAPDEFHVVAFDHDAIAHTAEDLLAAVGLAGHDLVIEVDERTLLGRIDTDIGERITLRVSSGALEDTRRPRQQSEVATRLNLGRALLRAADRLHGGFSDAPADDDLSLAQVAAWDTYCVGRLARLGVPVYEQRWRYNFRNRHGFTDAADAAFDRLWNAESLSWPDIEQAVSIFPRK